MSKSRRRFVPRMIFTAACAGSVVPLCALEGCGGKATDRTGQPSASTGGAGPGGSGGRGAGGRGAGGFGGYFGVGVAFVAGGAFGMAGGSFGNTGGYFGMAGGSFGVDAAAFGNAGGFFSVAAIGFGGAMPIDAGPTDAGPADAAPDSGSGGHASLDRREERGFGEMDARTPDAAPSRKASSRRKRA